MLGDGRRCLAVGTRVAREVDLLIVARGRPKRIVSDNGTELTSNANYAAQLSPQPAGGAPLLDGSAPWPVAPLAHEMTSRL